MRRDAAHRRQHRLAPYASVRAINRLPVHGIGCAGRFARFVARRQECAPKPGRCQFPEDSGGLRDRPPGAGAAKRFPTNLYSIHHPVRERTRGRPEGPWEAGPDFQCQFQKCLSQNASARSAAESIANRGRIKTEHRRMGWRDAEAQGGPVRVLVLFGAGIVPAMSTANNLYPALYPGGLAGEPLFAVAAAVYRMRPPETGAFVAWMPKLRRWSQARPRQVWPCQAALQIRCQPPRLSNMR